MDVRQNVLEVMEERRLKWYAHLKRMSEEMILKRITDWEAEGGRRKGRPSVR